MAQMTEVKFGDFQIDQRYKKLERELKLASLRKEHNINESISSPHFSNIDSNLTKSSTSISTLHNSKMDNDVVSSSKNLRNIFLQRNLTKRNSLQDDYLMMKPPSTHKVPRTSNKSNYTLRCNSRVSNEYTDSVNSLQNSSDNLQNKKTVVFMKWKVMLTERGQLAVKGILQCKKYFQTKPIVKRLTGTSVECACKDVYHLQGNIVDDDEELPEYVRGKFYNGFPEDWRNVHQLWKTYIQQGCRLSFRWPTAIADSDDDLKSEVTDVTYLHSENFKHDLSDSRSLKKSFDSECSINCSQNDNNKTFTLHNCERRNSYAQTSISISENSLYNTNIQIPSKKYNMCNAECDKTLEDLSFDYTDTKNKVALKGKLNTLLNNLLDKNCPKKCISEIIKIVECLNNVVSIESNESTTEDLKQENQKNKQDIETSSDSEKLESVSMVNNTGSMQSNSMLYHKCTAEDKIVNNEIANSYELLPRKRTFTKMNEDNSNDSFESENEIYAGTPKIPVRQFFKKRGTLTKSYKRRSKKVAHKKYDVASKHASDTSSSDSSIDKLRSKQNDDIHLKDCSAKHETHFSGTKRDDINPNITKSVDFDMSKEEQWNRLSNLNNDKSIHKVQKCFIGENSTPIHRSASNVFNCLDGMKTRKSEYMLTENHNNIEKQMNFDAEQTSEETKEEANSDKEHTNENYTYRESPKKFTYNNTSKIAKPTITSSIPVYIKVKDSGSKLLSEPQKPRTNVVDNEKKSTKESNKENKKTRKRSPIKLRGVKTDNSTLLSDSKKNIEKHIEVQLDDVDSTTLKMSQANLEIFKDSQQNISNHKPKKLTAWAPKVLCKSELSLIFEGSLLNDAGHLVSKKFQTDNVLRRVSAKVIETEDHELYELVGDLNDKKHAVPKELVNDCRNGCPARIDQFCRKWKILQENANSTQDITTIGDLNVGVSSKGRRIIRPLSYWTGERITFKDDNPIYSPGISEATTNKMTDNEKIESSEFRKSDRIKKQRKSKPKLESDSSLNREYMHSHKKEHRVKRNKPKPLSSRSENLVDEPPIFKRRGLYRSNILFEDFTK
nr:PREDICTED: uncharacterized protein LOC100879988 isoform X2 [Megachile rotundata]